MFERKNLKTLIRRQKRTDTAKQNQEGAQQQRSQDVPYPALSPRYTLLEQIGEGAFSTVFKAIDNNLNMTVAIKIIDKRELKKNQMNTILKEIAIMRRLNHPNVVKLFDYINTESTCFIVMEYVSGGELFNQIVKLTYFSENLSRHIIIQVVKAVDYLHSEVGVVHRDIKPENLFFEQIDFFPGKQQRRHSDDSSKVDEGEFKPNVGGGTVGRVKLGDFGLSKILWDSNTKTPCGTASYTAPEIVKDESYSKSVDMWAIGCVLYTLLCGFPPFYDSDPKVLTLKVSRGEYTFLSPWWDEISKEAKDLVSHLLTVDPVKRYCPEDVLNHPWILKNSRPTTPAPDAPLYQTKNESILRFEQVIPHESTGPLSPRAEALKFAFDKGISIQRTATPLRRLLDEDAYFNESDDAEDENDDTDDDDDNVNDTRNRDSMKSEDDDEDEPNENEYIYTRSPVLRKFSNHTTPLPLTPYVTIKKKSDHSAVVERSEQSSEVQQPLPPNGHYEVPIRQPIPVSLVKRLDNSTFNPTHHEFRQSESFQLTMDGNTLLSRRKMSGSVACGPAK